jgi:transposase-like protein
MPRRAADGKSRSPAALSHQRTYLPFYAMPRAHWKMLRTTNAIERCFRELRRRTDSIGTFLDDASISRLIFALMDHLNRKRAGKVCKEFKTKAKLAA